MSVTCSRWLQPIADTFTSVLAILALVGGRYLGWRFLDPLMGIVISRWSYGLCRGAAYAAALRRHAQLAHVTVEIHKRTS